MLSSHVRCLDSSNKSAGWVSLSALRTCPQEMGGLFFSSHSDAALSELLHIFYGH